MSGGGPSLVDALRDSPHPWVRGIAKDSFVREGLEGILATRRHYAPFLKARDNWKPIFLQRLEDLIRAVEKTKVAVRAVPYRSKITEGWVQSLEGIGREATELRPTVEPPRTRTKASRDALVRAVLRTLVYRCDLERHPMTHEPKGFAAEAAEVVCSVAGFPFPTDDKERRLLIERAFVAIQNTDRKIRTVKGRSSSPRRG